MTRYLKSQLLDQVPGIVHGFGNREESLPAPFATIWDERRPRWQQVHKVDVAEVIGPAQVCGEVDALYSREARIPIAVMTADCVPVLLARKDGGAVAAVHAGWRGTRARILAALWKKLAQQGEKPSDWVGAIGPSIGPCCYEVSEEISADFEREFSAMGPASAVPTHRHLDLPAINAEELRALGIGQVEILRACTRCSEPGGAPSFWSYRRDGSGTRQWSVIQIAKP